MLMLFTWLYVRVYLVVTCEKNMQDRIIPLRAEVWSHKTVTHRASLLIEVPMSSQEIRVITKLPNSESESSCICARGIDFVFSTILILDIGTVWTVWYFFLFHYIIKSIWMMFNVKIYFLHSQKCISVQCLVLVKSHIYSADKFM
jgi:hypothetical protein